MPLPAIRTLSAKLLLAALVAVVAPFLAFTIFVHHQMEQRLSADVVKYFLKSTASYVADKIDLLLEERGRDLRIWSEEPTALRALRDPGDAAARRTLDEELNRYTVEKEVYDVLLVADRSGAVFATNTVDRENAALSPGWGDRLLRRNLAGFEWYRRALAGEVVRIDCHRSPLTQDDPAAPSTDPRDWGVGFAAPIRDPEDGGVAGVWYALLNWSFVQERILDRVRDYFRELRSPEFYESGYAWLWKADADTILGHKERRLYGRRVSGGDIRLPQLTAAALAESWGVFPEYEYPPGVPKTAAFRHCAGPERGGFGWIVGIGINDDDIFRSAHELGVALMAATGAILAGVLVWTWFLSRHLTKPLRGLIAFTRKVSGGDLSGRVETGTRDEIGELAGSFNRMTADLAASRERIVRAEKEAAWREMARQIAHEIKNPLTPMRLTTTLLQRARREGSARFDEILDQATRAILRQIESLQRIASDFGAFAGTPRRDPKPVSLSKVARECLDLYEGWAAEKRLRTEVFGGDGVVVADPEELRRVVVNLLDNAFEASPEGGAVRVEVADEGKTVRIGVEDEGPGIPREVRDRLFEPYFSTKTTGTGLGLAICRRIAADLGGSIAIENRDGGGTRVVVRLPRAEPPAA